MLCRWAMLLRLSHNSRSRVILILSLAIPFPPKDMRFWPLKFIATPQPYRLLCIQSLSSILVPFTILWALAYDPNSYPSLTVSYWVLGQPQTWTDKRRSLHKYTPRYHQDSWQVISARWLWLLLYIRSNSTGLNAISPSLWSLVSLKVPC